MVGAAGRGQGKPGVPENSELRLELAEAQGGAGAGRHGPVLLRHPSPGCSGG